MGASLGNATERASLPAGRQSEPNPPAQSVTAAAGETQGPARTILTAAPPAARAPATQLGAAGARGQLEEGAEPAAAARSGRGCGRRLLTGPPLGRNCWEAGLPGCGARE
ncbi:uncharacterized protein V5649_015164 isoform 1-T1 [Rhynchonycteris naso]